MNQPIAFTHKIHARAKSLKIKINNQGEVVVISPKFTPKFVVNLFVKNNQNWIEKTLAKIKQQQQPKPHRNELMIFGKKYQKVIQTINSTKSNLGVKIKADQAIINVLKKEDKQKYVDRFLKNTASKYILPRTHSLAKKMQIDFGKITLRQQKSRWGSCSSKGNLNFNWRLVHAAPEVIDYVIIHELSHRKHMDHSRNFWNLVERFDPEYKKHRGFLKRQGMNLS